jgi:hypothetical protein
MTKQGLYHQISFVKKRPASGNRPSTNPRGTCATFGS